jgi:protein phosphatase
MTAHVAEKELPTAVSLTTADPAPATVRRPLHVRSHGRTDQGKVRTSNEDQFLTAVLTKALQVRQTSLRQPQVQYGAPQGWLYLVADGVGGHRGGEQASAMAVNAVETFVLDALNWCIHLRKAGNEQILTEFQTALKQADDALVREGDRHPELHGMATTLTLAYYFDGQLFVAHVGDSRCYLIRKDSLYRVTRDHTLVAQMVERGVLEPEEAARHAYRHVVTNVVGGSDHGVQVEVHKLVPEPGDRLLLCSDGLTEMVTDAEILSILTAAKDPESASERLMKRANDAGGRDNITVVVASFED